MLLGEKRKYRVYKYITAKAMSQEIPYYFCDITKKHAKKLHKILN